MMLHHPGRRRAARREWFRQGWYRQAGWYAAVACVHLLAALSWLVWPLPAADPAWAQLSSLAGVAILGGAAILYYRTGRAGHVAPPPSKIMTALLTVSVLIALAETAGVRLWLAWWASRRS